MVMMGWGEKNGRREDFGSNDALEAWQMMDLVRSGE